MIALSKAQLVSGSGKKILTEAKAGRSYTPTNWLGSIRTFLQMCSASISIPDAWSIKQQRVNDQILMDMFEAMKPSLDMLEKLNTVCLFLGVCTLADICNKSGTQIEPWALSERKQAKPMIPWPNQEQPAEQCWVKWRHFLKTVFAPSTSKSHRMNKHIKLQSALGIWVTTNLYTARGYCYNPEGGN
eukprot:13735090-Ditylum_brightwellii.AAC.1